LEVFTFPAQGGSVKSLKGAKRETTYFETLLAPGEWCMTSLQNGKQIGSLHKVISKDGKVMRQTSKYILEGKAYEDILIYEKQ
jgi:hypothetical protein